MKELAVILKKFEELEKAAQSAVLATVVDVVGSGYRRPGARMLIDENGFGIGTVSGGCLEADVLERAKKVFATGEPVVITYDTTKDENSLFGLGMGCRGIVRIMLEKTENNELFDYFRKCYDARERFCVATCINAPIPPDFKSVGKRLFYDTDGMPLNSRENDGYRAELRQTVAAALNDNKSLTQIFQTAHGEIEFFIEVLNPPLNLLLFGAGYDALPLVKFAKELGWRVTAIDHRPAFANWERLAEADEIIVSSSEDLPVEIFQDENSVAVVMTHNYDRDREIMRRLLGSKCRYVGALGPKKRTARLLEEIGETRRAEQLEKLHAPIGLDIGADTPEAIALSIVAEIQAILSNRNGGFLRERQGSIYGRNE